MRLGRVAVVGGDGETRAVVGEMDRLHTAAELFRGHPRYAAPGAAAEAIRRLLDESRLRVFAS